MSLTFSNRQILVVSAILLSFQGVALANPAFAQPQQQWVVNGKPVSENVGKAMMLFNNASNLLIGSEKPEKAVELLTQAEQLAPELPEIQSNLGMALAKMGRTDEAIVHVEKAVALNPNLPAAEMTLGSLYQSVGRTQDAIRVFKDFQQRHPTSEHIKKIKGLLSMLESESKLQTKQPDGSVTGADDYFSSIGLSGSVTKWTQDHMPLKVYIAPTQGVVGYKPGYMDGVKSSFQAWADASGGKVSFVYVQDKEKNDISFAFSNDIKAVSNPAEGGEAKVYPGPKGIVKSTIVVLTLDPSPAQQMSESLMRWICLHEIGHAIGLMGHSSQHNDVMYSSMPLATIDRGLSERDKNTLKHLYSDDVVVHKADTSNMASDSTDPMTLNNQGATALNAGNLELSLQCLEKAHKIDPSMKVVKQNLAQAYSIKAMRTVQAGKLPDADAMFKKSIALLDGGNKTPIEITVLRNYLIFLKLANRGPEAAKIEAMLKGGTSK
ncbi:MAG TPA: tetratricopeptide repeat protein [Candidatus Melainabacteria bacterium]|nr:tetratricopeptide repeat protein [Candidatus Melainabacteria bacterium]HIN65758.1 tetratricopeptide repeat protein [Candidatus Obscuribacterales bacterium]